jgi:hypothetical protein
MKITKKLVIEIMTGLDNDTFNQHEDPPAKGDSDFQEAVDEIAALADVHSDGFVFALGDFIDGMSAEVAIHELEDYVADHYLGSDRTAGEVLKAYAQHDDFDLGKLYAALNKADAMDEFDWNAYAKTNAGPVVDLHFYDTSNVFLFKD